MHDRLLSVLTSLFFVSELTLAISRRSRNAGGATRKDRGSGPLLWIVISLAVTTAYALAGNRPGRFPFPSAWVRPVAIALLASGAALRWWAVITLGRFFTVDVATHIDHALVESGPFRFVRHPSYSGLILEFLGLGVALGNALSVLVVMAPVILTLSYRMRVEEDALRQALGGAYDDYCARTKRLIPGLI